jgi:hypothetical protein
MVSCPFGLLPGDSAPPAEEETRSLSGPPNSVDDQVQGRWFVRQGTKNFYR